MERLRRANLSLQGRPRRRGETRAALSYPLQLFNPLLHRSLRDEGAETSTPPFSAVRCAGGRKGTFDQAQARR